MKDNRQGGNISAAGRKSKSKNVRRVSGAGILSGRGYGRKSGPFPFFHGTPDHPEKRVRPDLFEVGDFKMFSSVPFFQLLAEPSKFITQLAGGDRDLLARSSRSDLFPVETIASVMCFFPDKQEIDRDRRLGPRMPFEPVELGMISVAGGFSEQDFLGQQRFTPKRHESLRIQIFRVQTP